MAEENVPCGSEKDGGYFFVSSKGKILYDPPDRRIATYVNGKGITGPKSVVHLDTLLEHANRRHGDEKVIGVFSWRRDRFNKNMMNVDTAYIDPSARDKRTEHVLGQVFRHLDSLAGEHGYDSIGFNTISRREKLLRANGFKKHSPLHPRALCMRAPFYSKKVRPK